MKSNKLMKKFIVLIITVLMLFSCFNVSAVSTKDFEYTIENGLVTITKYTGNSDNVVVPAEIDGYPVKTIAFDAFMNDNSENIKKVVVSEGIEYVGDWLFTSCDKMESITLPSTIKSLATDWFFVGSKNLKEFKLSGKNERYYIDKGILYDSQEKQLMLCPAQNEFENYEYKILDGTTNIRSWAFSSCSGLEKVIIPDSVTLIGDSAFSGCCNLEEIVLSENINTMGNNAFGSLINLKEITIPKSVTGFYYDGRSTHTQLGYHGSSKIDNFTIKGYLNSEAEKYAKDNGFTFIALDKKIDCYSLNPIEFIGMSFEEIINIFGSYYTETQELESGATKFICYPDTDNPFTFGFDENTNIVKAVYVYDISNKSVKLFDDITNKSILSDIKNSSTSYPYVINDNVHINDTTQTVNFTYDNGILVSFEWNGNDETTQPVNRVLILQQEVVEPTVPETTVPQDTTAPQTTEDVKTTTASTESTTSIATNDIATPDNTTNNGIVNTGDIPFIIAILLVVISVGTGIVFVILKKKSTN